MRKCSSSPSLCRRSCRALKGTVLLSGLAVGGIAVVNALLAAATPRLSPRIQGQFGRYPARFGDVAYTVAGSGPALLLLHGLDAGRSMAEWRAVAGELANNYTVYSFDWLGWGLSDAARDGFSAEEFAELLEAFLRDVVKEPAIVMAAGQSGIFALLAAQRGAQIERLVLVCPVPAALDDPSGQSRAEALLQGAFAKAVLRSPVIGTAIINWLRSKTHLEGWARTHGFYNKERAREEVPTLYVAAHQDAAGAGQRALLLGAFRTDWRAAWSAFSAPALLVWGRSALGDGLDAAPEWLALQPTARLEVLDDTLLLPHLEAPDQFLKQVLPWLSHPKS